MTLALKMADARYDGYDEGYEEGISIGLERGAYQTKLETARKLIIRGYAPEEIADVSGLTLSQVQELLDS